MSREYWVLGEQIFTALDANDDNGTSMRLVDGLLAAPTPVTSAILAT